MSNDIGQMIQQFRERSGMTQGRLASFLGVSQQSVAKWESGQSAPRQAALKAMMDLFGWSFDPSAPNREISGHYSSSPKLVFEDDEVVPPTSKSAEMLEDRFPPFIQGQHDNREMERLVHHANEPIAAFLPDGFGTWKDVNGKRRDGKKFTLVTDDLLVSIAHVHGTRGLHTYLLTPIYRALWKMLVERESTGDTRSLLLVIAMHEATAEINDTPYGKLEHVDILLHRVTTEASRLGISVFLAKRPSQAASIIKSFTSPDTELDS